MWPPAARRELCQQTRGISTGWMRARALMCARVASRVAASARAQGPRQRWRDGREASALSPSGQCMSWGVESLPRIMADDFARSVLCACAAECQRSACVLAAETLLGCVRSSDSASTVLVFLQQRRCWVACFRVTLAGC